MIKISEIISMPVISIYEGEQQGIIFNILFDSKLKKCKFACVLNETDKIKKVLNINHIYKIGKDCIFLKNNSILDLECNNDRIIDNYLSILNVNVFDLNGTKLGICFDVEIDNKFNILNIILNNNQKISKNKLVNISKNAILVYDSPVRISKFKPNNNTSINNIKDNKVIMLSEIDSTITQKSNYQSNTKIITDSHFLLDRIIEKDIQAINGEIIAKKNTTINKNTISKASKYGKLIELARYSKKKM